MYVPSCSGSLESVGGSTGWAWGLKSLPSLQRSTGSKSIGKGVRDTQMSQNAVEKCTVLKFNCAHLHHILGSANWTWSVFPHVIWWYMTTIRCWQFHTNAWLFHEGLRHMNLVCTCVLYCLSLVCLWCMENHLCRSPPTRSTCRSPKQQLTCRPA